jgi:hypothetical protein
MQGEGTERVVNHEMQWAIEMVINGTIPVWRPVKHYKPQTQKGLALVKNKIQMGQFVFIENEDIVGFRAENTETFVQGVTHWVPLPPPPKEVSDE